MSSGGKTAPGHPGIEPRWTSSRKSGVGTAIEERSRVWFTISHGILNEIYYPRVDQANVRDMQFLVTSGDGYFSDEKRDTTSDVRMLAPGVPAYRVVNSSRDGRYRITKTIVADPERDALLQEVEFEALQGARGDYGLYVLLAPHLGNQGAGNDAWLGSYKGVPMGFAQRGAVALALASSTNFAAASCGFVGSSDGWQQLHARQRLTDCYTEARDGNVAITVQLDLERCDGRFVLALAFGPSPAEAGQSARAALLRDFAAARDVFVESWNRYHRTTTPIDAERDGLDEYHLSVAMLRIHEDKAHPGGMIASLSIPWGNTKGDHDLGGYHVAWARDLVESAGALLAAGHADGARAALHYLMVTQDADGHWPQNMWLDGRPYWKGNQLDETGFPILLADHLRRRNALGDLVPWPMVRLAASYLVRNGPVTPEDRWEEDGGYSTFSLAVEVASLLAAADFADAANEASVARYLRETADVWHDMIDRWTYVRGTDRAREAGVPGYYVRIAPPTVTDGGDGSQIITVKNHPPGQGDIPYGDMVSPDALALVRFGLRAANDPRIVDTVRVIDAALCTETPNGPVWHRYNDDGYGEHEDGSAFDGTGIGRGWPLLAGERGHYELAAGRAGEAQRLLGVMRQQTSPGGLIPEQVWDAPDIPKYELVTGCPSGSAMPLLWAHAEYVKLARSVQDHAVFDTPPQPPKRYIDARTVSPYSVWRYNHKLQRLPSGNMLRVELAARGMVRWSGDGWKTMQDVETSDTTLGIWLADLDTRALKAGAEIQLTLRWAVGERWEGRNYAVRVVER